MELDALLTIFLRKETLFICLSIVVITSTIRKVAEVLFPKVQKHRYWVKLFVPLAPVINGALLGFASKTFIWPEFTSTLFSRILYGSILGFFSAYLYARVWDLLKTKFKALTGGKDKEEPKKPAVVPAAAPAKAVEKPAEKPVEKKEA